MITKDGRDTAIENLTAENYIVPRGEEKFYHAVIEVRQFDAKTGKRLSKPRVQKFGRKTFETTVLPSLKKQGYTVTILHSPAEYFKALADKKAHDAEVAAAKLAEAEAAAKAAEEEKFNAAVDAAVKEKVDAALSEAVAKAVAEALAAAKPQAPAEGAEKPAEGTKESDADNTAKKPGRPAKTA